jgi:23S rRNA pseudouridine1911/1915/1917 synthase
MCRTFSDASYSPVRANFSVEPPKVLYNHDQFLVVYKPPGWRTINDTLEDPANPKSKKRRKPKSFRDVVREFDPKCLMTNLRSQELGGGPDRDFLKPCHRIDQPCSGLVVVAKTSNASWNIYSNWTDVKKTYLVVVEAINFKGEELLASGSTEWRKLRAVMDNRKKPRRLRDSFYEGKAYSVSYIPCASTLNMTTDEMRYCELEWRIVLDQELLEVRSLKAARHLIRGVLAAYGVAVKGDLRYGAKQALPDQSVALHGRTLQFPSSMKLENDIQTKYFASIPDQWVYFFGYTDNDIAANERTKLVGTNERVST